MIGKERLPYKISGRCKDYCKSEKCRYVWINAGSFHQGTGFDEETAEFIVRACNSHYDLVEALESALANAVFEKQAFRPWHDMARAALAKAKGEA